jgi:Rad3-related DNA helicase
MRHDAEDLEHDGVAWDDQQDGEAEAYALVEAVTNDLKRGGTLSTLLPGYEERPVQTRMARLVALAIAENTPVLIEAATGTGKGLGYLIPVVRSGKKVTISTSTKILQEQLYSKDVPFVQRYIQNRKVVLIKGSGNYICLDRVEEARRQFAPLDLTLRRLIAFLDADPGDEFTGDIESLDFPVTDQVRQQVQFEGSRCSWEHCHYYKDCYIRSVRARAQEADILIINHTLLLLDAVRSGFVLPKGREVLVIDEGHALEEEAIRAFTVTVTPGQITSLLAQQFIQDVISDDLHEAVRESLTATWNRLAEIDIREPSVQALIPESIAEGVLLAKRLDALAEALKIACPLGLSAQQERLYKKLMTRTRFLAQKILFVFTADRSYAFAYYVERVGQEKDVQLHVSAAPLKVAALLQEKVFTPNLTICTSATLATVESAASERVHPLIPTGAGKRAPSFAYFHRSTGWGPRGDEDVSHEYILPSTFNYRDRALLYLPTHLPEPRYDDEERDGEKSEGYLAYIQSLATEMSLLAQASRGRAFLLFTSKRMMDEVYSLMIKDTSLSHLNFLLQGSNQTRKDMLRSFREQPSLLFGLKSFSEGVDIAGEALSLVIVAKLPFPYPYDPVQQARVKMMELDGENWFGLYVLPQVILRLKQSLGRLLRTSTDEGVMAILDKRMHSRSYGADILTSLPPARVTTRYADVERFFQTRHPGERK